MSPDRWPFRIFLVLLFWLPIPLGSNRDWAWLLAAAIVLGLAAWMWLLLSRDRVAPSAALLAAKWPLLALAGWLVWGCLQWLPLPVGLTAWLSPASAWPQPVELVAGWSSLSVDPFRSFLSWLQSLSLALIFVLALQCANRPRRVRRLVGVLILAGVVQAVYGGFMTLSGIEWSLVAPKEFNRGLATGTFVNRNHLAGFLVLCTTIGIGYLLGQMRETAGKREWRQRMRDWARLALGPKMRLRVYLSLMVIALVLTHSRMGNASLFSAMMIAGVLGLFLLRRAPRAMLTLVVSLLIIDIVIVGTWFGVEQVVDRIQTTGTWSEQGQRYRDQDRLDVDNEVLNAWQSFRLLGSGGGTFYTVFPAYRQSDISHYFDHAHND
jgi:O-antigen ligase